METTDGNARRTGKTTDSQDTGGRSVSATTSDKPGNNFVAVRRRRASFVFRDNGYPGDPDPSQGEIFLGELFQKIVKSETDDTTYADLEAWDLLEQATRGAMNGEAPDDLEFHDTPSLYVAAQAVKTWLESYRAIMLPRLAMQITEGASDGK